MAFEVANAMAVMLVWIEGANVHVIYVETSVHPSRVTPRTNLRELARWRSSGGGTDMSLPFSYALEKRLNFHGVIYSPTTRRGVAGGTRRRPSRRTGGPSTRALVSRSSR